MNLEEIFKQANFYRDNDQNEEALELFEKILNSSSGADPKLRANSQHLKAITLYNWGKFEWVWDELLKTQEMYEKLGEKTGVGAVLRDLGSTAVNLGDYDKAEKLMEESIKVLKDADDGELGISQVKLGTVYLAQGKLDEAEKITINGIKTMGDVAEDYYISTGYMNLAEILIKMGKISEAKQNLEKSLESLNKFAKPDEHLRRRKKLNSLLHSVN